jgi:hypothetical protein
MKALVRFIIFGAVLFPVFSIAISCSEEADCSMTTRAMMQCYLYTLDPDTKVVSNDTLDSLTVTAFGTDSVIINNQNSFLNFIHKKPRHYSRKNILHKQMTGYNIL